MRIRGIRRNAAVKLFQLVHSLSQTKTIIQNITEIERHKIK